MLYFVNEFVPELIVLGKPKDKSCMIYYPMNSLEHSSEFSKLRLQTPKMKLPFIPKHQRTKSDNRIFLMKISLSFQDIGSERNIKMIDTFSNQLLGIDKRVKELLPSEYNDYMFYSSLYKGYNSKYKPTMTVDLPYKGDECETVVFNKHGEEVSESNISQGMIVSCILRLDGIWFSHNTKKMGMTWKVEQLKMYSKYIT